MAPTVDGATIVDSSDPRMARLAIEAASSSPPNSGYAIGYGAKYTPGSSGS